MYTLKSDLLEVNIKHIGAELCNITSKANNNEFIWQADSSIWGSHAPNLFPIIGCMKDDSYIFEGKRYNMPKHGFLRYNDDFIVKSQSENTITFLLTTNSSLYDLFPFQFEFEIKYTLNNNTLDIKHTVRNLDSKTMYFSVGGHPAFNCPLYEGEDYTDYYLDFNAKENSESYQINTSNGLITSETKPVFNDYNKIYLKPDLFNADALVFKDLNSRKVTLTHKTKGPLLSVSFNDFTYLGIWAKPNAPYVCIEPWLGIADTESTTQKLEEKEGILSLQANKTFEATYSIEIAKNHLV